MTRYGPAFMLLTVGFTPVSGQQPNESHRWRTLVAAPDVRIELDTASVQPVNHHRRVWLRWTFPTPVPDLADFQLERREVDCARAQTRVLGTDDSSGRRRAQPRVLRTDDSSGRRAASDSAAVWIHPSRGSLEHQALEAVCRWVEAGA